MHVEQICFERVFDAHPGRGDFSFESKGRSCYSVRLQRGMIPRAGARYLVAFAIPDDWSTVLGWRDPQAGTSGLPEPVWYTVLSGIGSLIWFGPFFLGGALLVGGPGAALAVVAAICAFACVRLYRVMGRNRQVRRTLEQAQVDAVAPAGPRSSPPGLRSSEPGV